MAKVKEDKVCGVVMPISSFDACSESHWTEVSEILNAAINDAGFNGNLVSDADDVGIIHKRIIQNLYDNPIVVCDVSCKNPNVMFELGLRLAFDKPTIIVKDDKTSYSFDTGVIEHLEYPRDLRFAQIVEFKKLLAEKIKATYNKSTQDQDYTTFLKHFGEFKVAKIDQKEVPGQEFIIEELRSIRRAMNKLEQGRIARKYDYPLSPDPDIDICLGFSGISHLTEKLEDICKHPALRRVTIKELDEDHHHLTADVIGVYPKNKLEEKFRNMIGLRSTHESKRNKKSKKS